MECLRESAQKFWCTHKSGSSRKLISQGATFAQWELKVSGHFSTPCLRQTVLGSIGLSSSEYLQQGSSPDAYNGNQPDSAANFTFSKAISILITLKYISSLDYAPGLLTPVDTTFSTHLLDV